MLVKNENQELNALKQPDENQGFLVGNILQKGYGILPNIILFDRNLSPTAKLLYCLISSLSAEKGFCFASNKFLAERMGLKTAQITRLIAQLSKYLDVENPRAFNRRIFLSSSKMINNIIKNDEVNIIKNDEHNNININITKEINSVFSFWNEKDCLIFHRKLTSRMVTKIKSVLKDYSEDDIKTAINKYNKVISSPEYFWSYRWTLDEFLARGVTKFLEKPLNEFKKFETRSEKEIEKDQAKENVINKNKLWADAVEKCGNCDNGFIKEGSTVKKCSCVKNL